MKDLIIDGSHFSGMLQAVDFMLTCGYRDTEVELVCDEEKELYILRVTRHGEHNILTTIPY